MQTIYSPQRLQLLSKELEEVWSSKNYFSLSIFLEPYYNYWYEILCNQADSTNEHFYKRLQKRVPCCREAIDLWLEEKDWRQELFKVTKGASRLTRQCSLKTPNIFFMYFRYFLVKRISSNYHRKRKSPPSIPFTSSCTMPEVEYFFFKWLNRRPFYRALFLQTLVFPNMPMQFIPTVMRGQVKENRKYMEYLCQKIKSYAPEKKSS